MNQAGKCETEKFHHDGEGAVRPFGREDGRVSLYEIQRLLTQQSPEMAQRYAHLADAALRRAADAAVRALTPCTAKDMESDEAGESIVKRGECLFAEPGDEG